MTTTRTATTVLGGLDDLRGSASKTSTGTCTRTPSSPTRSTAPGAEVAGRRRGRLRGPRRIGGTGVVGVLRNGDGLDRAAAGRHGRAAGQEATGLPYASTGDGHRRRRQPGAGNARLRPRRPRHLPARRRRNCSRPAAHWNGTCRPVPARRGDR